MVDDDELERHVNRVESEIFRSASEPSDGTARIGELEATMLRIGEELTRRIEDVDRAVPSAEDMANIERRLSAIENRLDALERKIE